MLFGTSSNASDGIHHQIRGDIWPTKNLRRVTNNLESYSYFNAIELEFECDELKNVMTSYFQDKNKEDNKNNETINLGKICNKLVTLINFGKMENIPNFKAFTAAHEGFHLAVQIFGSPYAYGIDIAAEKNYAFITDFIDVVRESIAKNNNCLLITTHLDQLSENKRKYLLFRAMYEWPAEYYAKMIFFKNDQNYLAFRKLATEQSEIPDKWHFNSLYTLSIEFITNLEVDIKSDNWKQRVNSGESIIDIYLKNNGCKSYSDSWSKGTVNDYSLY
ncbi:MAG: hypothetical protein ACI9LM_003722 [Alteromonadaceae bacterium]|jgi:hypothetical protein